MINVRRTVLAAACLAALGTAAIAAGNYLTYPIVGQSSFCASTVTGTTPGGSTGQGQGTTGSICAQTIPAGPPTLTGSELIPADTSAAGPTQTVTIPAALLANMSGTPRNYLDNGSINVQQRGTGIVTCGTTSVPSTAYGPDRWGCYANVTSGAGRQQVATTAALLPAGFGNVNKVYRNSGALTQPVCSIQEIPTVESTALAGKQVTFSFYATALAGLSADNSNVITASIFTGTGSDEGLGTMTASPAITPAWTGIAAAVNQTAITITTTPTRYSVTGSIPSTATEVAVALCFTPTATGAGTTDGFAFTGTQLEVAPSPSAYEFHFYSFDLARAQRYFYRITESASAVTFRGVCAMSTTSIANCSIPFPQVMRSVPTMTYTAGFTASASTASTSATVCTNVTTSATLSGSAASTTGVLINCASSAGFGAAGTAGFLWDLGTGSSTGVLTASADF